ncbi:hypothetical protein SY212_22220 [Ligilactobacillus agilis]|uniref:Uncharacterized protein n=1 Tax=Ligilactobacillus agilis TaxID=1601 RepID=A0A6F9XPM0_9LACO|nr:hypothetical protein [Ligilactobacillus agilis]GET07192.1 hypothetical protein SY212_22220 [Ligilactobacillus agilis]
MEQYIDDDITHDDIVALRRSISALDEFLVKLDRDRGHNYKELGNERRTLEEMSYAKALMEKLAGGELPPAQIKVLI